jgi:acyl-CoA thioester hydrolase
MDNFIFPVKIYIEDTDFGRVAYHANYLKFFERARSEWLESAGLGIEWQQQEQIYFVIRTVKLDYLKPARLNDHLEVISHINECRPASITFHQQLRKSETTDTILCKAEVKVVCVNEAFRPRALPQKLYEIIMGEHV